MKSALVRNTLKCRLPCWFAALAIAGQPALAHRELDWYDEQTRQLKSPTLQPLQEPQAPQKWVWKPWQPNNQSSSWRFPAIGDFAARLIEVIIWIAAGLGIIWLIVYVLRYIQDQQSDTAADVRAGPEEAVIQMQKLAELPFAAGRSKVSLWDAARERYEQGDYDRAILYLFGYQLLQLDRHQRIRLWKGKTNRQYLREIKHDSWLSDLLAETIEVFEGSYFGHHPVRREQFESCWSRMQEFHRHLEVPA